MPPRRLALPESLAEQALRFAARVHVCGVDEVDASRRWSIDEGVHIVLGQTADTQNVPAEGHGAEADARN